MRATLLMLGLGLLFGCGDRPSPEGLVNDALAALRAGAPREAESLAVQAAARGGPEIDALCDFLRGNVAFARTLLAERQADTPEAEPFAFDIAIRYGESARDLWQLAATSRPDWPEARRNVERALLKLATLARKKTDARRRKERRPDPKPPPKPEPPPDPGGEIDEEPGTEPELTELEPEQVLRLFEKLREKEKEKLALRRAHRAARMVEVEKDW